MDTASRCRATRLPPVREAAAARRVVAFLESPEIRPPRPTECSSPSTSPAGGARARESNTERIRRDGARRRRAGDGVELTRGQTQTARTPGPRARSGSAVVDRSYAGREGGRRRSRPSGSPTSCRGQQLAVVDLEAQSTSAAGPRRISRVERIDLARDRDAISPRRASRSARRNSRRSAG